MSFSHEKLRVYQKALTFVASTHNLLNDLPPLGSVKNQLERASTSIPLNIAEGNGKASKKDRARFLQIAHGSAVECAACLDIIAIKHGEPNTASEVEKGKKELISIVNMLIGMLTKLDCRYDVQEEAATYGAAGNDSNNENAAFGLDYEDDEEEEND